MAWIKVESSVARNRKFVKAGPAASWLWLCGLAYCQEGLTDGFIPPEAIDYLGVPKASRLAVQLVLAGLWDACDGGGWDVHDYLEHNRSASDVGAIREERRGAGARGGKASGEARRKHVASATTKQQVQHVEANAKQRANPSVAVVVADVVAVAVSSEGGPGETDPPLDAWFRDLVGAYPPSSVSDGHLTEQAFFAAVVSQGTPAVTFTVMLGNLENQKRGHQWRVKGMVPRLDRWLKDGLWKQVHDADPPAAEQVSARTMRMLGSV